ncbi:hypothetical protein BJV78DRAFT_484658 [Lactifluus subvellereus]|nr:hypothetical protein BJV78DRAFT_484658 [Lactifluus subvellereus]
MIPEDLSVHLIEVAAVAGLLLVTTAGASALAYASRFDKVPQHTSRHSGQGRINELLNGHDGTRTTSSSRDHVVDVLSFFHCKNMSRVTLVLPVAAVHSRDRWYSTIQRIVSQPE